MVYGVTNRVMLQHQKLWKCRQLTLTGMAKWRSSKTIVLVYFTCTEEKDLTRYHESINDMLPALEDDPTSLTLEFVDSSDASLAIDCVNHVCTATDRVKSLRYRICIGPSYK